MYLNTKSLNEMETQYLSQMRFPSKWKTTSFVRICLFSGMELNILWSFFEDVGIICNRKKILLINLKAKICLDMAAEVTNEENLLFIWELPIKL